MLSAGHQQSRCCLACRRAIAALSHVHAACRLHQSKLLPADYIAVKHSYDHDWPLKEDDFFPYADCPTCYWTGTYLPTACIACVFCRPALWPAMLVADVKSCLPAAGTAAVPVPLQCVLAQYVTGWAGTRLPAAARIPVNGIRMVSGSDACQ